MNDKFLAIDPGKEKTGIAIFNLKGEILEHEIIDSKKLIFKLQAFLEKYDIDLIVMGNGTSSKSKYNLIKLNFANVKLKTINEYRTTDEARKLYFKENPPKGWKRLIPLGMQVPPVPVDDYAAIAIGKKYLNKLNLNK